MPIQQVFKNIFLAQQSNSGSHIMSRMDKKVQSKLLLELNERTKEQYGTKE